MKKLYFLVAISIVMLGAPVHVRAIAITDGDFSSWTFGAYDTFGAPDTATVTREPSGGNPDDNLNVTTISGLGYIPGIGKHTVYGTAIYNDFTIDQYLTGTPFELQLDALSGPGSFGQGQRIQLLVEQGSSIYGYNLDITGYLGGWDTLTFSGTFAADSFTLFSTTGPEHPDFDGGVDTRFGFAAGNTNSGTLTQYYDNFQLEFDIAATPVPDLATIWLLGTGIVGLLGWGRKRIAK